MANRTISYTTRDYQGIRTELLNYVRTYYPELIQDQIVAFNLSSKEKQQLTAFFNALVDTSYLLRNGF